ncbi:MAG TPA: homoserine kinase [Firmicutes bacterium]|nr:homoserine kinase [Bacillota bacterium]HOQ24932.1 homoserine kinase [Bacillota bacterium]HPT68296.1 homoserine kinase [Bacillota bacterium]
MKFKSFVPATSANLGPGYDVFGMALQLYNTVEFQPADEWEVTAAGYGAEKLSGRTDIYVCTAIRRVYEEAGVTLAGARVHLENNIPGCGGLGSSAAAIVSGLEVANASLNYPFSRREIFRMACAIEGHPDNVAAAVYGGIVAVCCDEKEEANVVNLPVPEGIKAVICIPDLKVSTPDARRSLPAQVSLQDAVFNLSRVSLFITSLYRNEPSLLCSAMRDKLHQPYREALVPGLSAAIDGAIGAGAYGAALSGSGPTVLAVCSGQANIDTIGKAMVDGFATKGVTARFLVLEPDLKGAYAKTIL